MLCHGKHRLCADNNGNSKYIDNAVLPCDLINQSIKPRFVGRRYTTRPGVPAIVSCKHDKIVHS